MEMEELAQKFAREENMPLKSLLAYGGLGVGDAGGRINSIIKGIIFAGHPYSDERKTKMEEALGEMLFDWHLLATTLEVSPKEIAQKFVSMYLVKGNKISEEVHVSILEMMKHLKIEAEELEKKKKDAKLKKQQREKLLQMEIERLRQQVKTKE